MNHPLVTGEFGWTDQTILHPVGLVLLIILGIAVQFTPRRYVVVPMLVMACFLSSQQRISIAGADFTMLRMAVLFAWVRVLHKQEYRGLRWHRGDLAMVLFATSGTLVFTLREGDLHSLVYKLGASFDALGLYFLFRCVLRSWEDLKTAIRVLTIISIPLAVAFTVEMVTQRNMFSVFGGVPEITAVREGRLRCQGAFSHPILAGCFWAALLPLIASRCWGKGSDRRLAIVGFFTSTTIIVMTASSTPVLGWVVCFVGAGAFVLRNHMRQLRWALVFTLFGLHLVMNKPVWHLLARVNVVGGSTGYHRFLLVDRAIQHFGEWWILGATSTAHWGHSLFDVTNQYVLEGVRGGFVTLVFFLVMIAFSFQRVGLAWRAVKEQSEKVAMIWGLGVSLFAHSVMFIGVSYFGQVILAWYFTLGMIGCLPVKQAAPRPMRDRSPARRRRRELPAVALHMPSETSLRRTLVKKIESR